MKRFIAFSLAWMVIGSSLVSAVDAPRLDWSAWDMLPVHDHGRVMPLDTFARENVEAICGSENPRLDLKAQTTKEQYASSELDEARQLFPNGEPRKFRAPEMLLSWIIEPEKWEYVPFVEAKHHELREFLELPLVNAEGDKIGFASPHELRDNNKFIQRIGEIAEQERTARQSGQELKLSELDQKIRQLGHALIRWQGLVFNNSSRMASNQRFADSLMTAVQAWRQVSPQLAMFRDAGAEKTGLREPIDKAQGSIDAIAQSLQDPNAKPETLEPLVKNFAAATRDLSTQFAGLVQRMREHPPAEGDPAKLAQMLDQISTQVNLASQAAGQVEQSLYASDKALRVVPALNAAALERDRDPDDESRPWLDLYTVIYGPAGALAAYPQSEVAGAREAFAQLAAVYPDRNQRPQDFAQALTGFSNSLRKLGDSIEPLRAKLPIKNIDDDLIAYTKYPPLGSTTVEVRYNRVQPFQWSWVINLLATCLFGVYMIGIRRKSIFNVGMALLFLGLAVAAYGFYMRVSVTGWAPVTNMYETVIFVPFFVAALGAWFALLPVTWDGVQAAWRLTAAPGTWEAKELTSEELGWMPRARWNLGSVILLIPRVALSALVLWILAIAPYSAGGRTIINLLPNVDAGERFPDANDLMTWGVGLLVLAPAVWYIPRLILSAVASLYTIPVTVSGRRAALFEQARARWPFCLTATFIAFFGAAVASFAPVLDDNFSPLQPVLRDNFWLLIHVLTIVASYGAGALAWGLANIALGFYLFGDYRQAQLASRYGHRPAQEGGLSAHSLKRSPDQTVVLSSYVYKAMQVAVVLLAAGTILGALWADVAWGRFWGWDPKEVWALISLLVYLAILHGRYAGMFGNFGLCAGAILGFSAIVMSWYGVNFVLGVGLHSYGFGEGGQWWVFGSVLLNWLYLAAATVRYRMETGSGTSGDGDAPGSATAPVASAAN